MKVTALLVSHDGRRWLRQVLAALADSGRAPDRVVAVDTGSTDGTPALLDAAGLRVVAAPREASFGDAVRAGLADCPPLGDSSEEEWIWLLHDDAAPDPDCLARLVEAATDAPDALAAVGPKLREWPSLRRLLEVGVTVSRTGRRETGLETGEYDQGQHDEQRRVLAVNTAGMLVRRSVLEEVGLDPALPVFGADLDLGWRLARRGREVRVVPAAVVFHAEAATRRGREGLVRPRRDARSAALWTLLVHARGRTAPWLALRLALGGLLRALGLLLVRAPQEAADEVAALRGVLGHPGALRAARRIRAGETTAAPEEVRALLAPAWMPWRHGLDLVVELVRALGGVARDTVVRRRDGSDRTVRGALMSPALWGFLALLVIALAAAGPLLDGAPLQGGALSPVPDGPGHWWSLWWSGWHWIGEGSSQPAEPAVLPLAMVSSVLLGQPALVVWLLFCALPPIAFLGAHRLLGRLCAGRWAPLWGAATWGLLPVLTGAVGEGRLGSVVVAVLLPWVAAAALRLGAPTPEQRARAGWRTALLGGLLTLFVPSALLGLVLLALAAPSLGGRGLTPAQRVGLVGVPLLLLAPWLPVLISSPGAWLVEAGRPGAGAAVPGPLALLAGHPGTGASGPLWLTLGLPIAALAALLRAEVTAVVRRCWMVALVAALVIWLHTEVAVALPGLSSSFRPWPGAWCLLLLGAWTVAAAVAADGLVPVMARSGFGWRQPVAAVAVAVAVLVPVGGAVWWLASGTPGPLHRGRPSILPGYMSDLAATRHDGATLLLRGADAAGNADGGAAVGYAVLRGAGTRIGDDSVLAVTPRRSDVGSAVAAVLGNAAGADRGGPADSTPAQRLADRGITYVYAPAPVDPAVAGALDASGGFATASSPHPRSRAWRVVPRAQLSAVPFDPSVLHRWLVALQLLGLATAVVLVLPGRGRR
ncbi:MAG: glycosyltransferase family 2 protein [Marmoricola sp.]